MLITYLTMFNETSETRISQVILVGFDGVPVAATKFAVRAFHALRIVARKLLDQNVGDRKNHVIDVLPLSQLLQKSQMNVDQILESGKHALEIRLGQTEVPSQSVNKDLLHGEEHQAVVLLREHELVYVLLPFHLPLAVIDKAQRDVASDRGTPRVRLLLSQRHLGIYLVEIRHGELMIVAKVKLFPAEIREKRKFSFVSFRLLVCTTTYIVCIATY